MDHGLTWIVWFGTDIWGRRAAAILLFGTMWILKSLRPIKTWSAQDGRWLTGDRKRFLLVAVLALGPAVPTLLDPSVPAETAWTNALDILLMAMGIQGGAKALHFLRPATPRAATSTPSTKDPP
jgi:hypothetical protein